MHTLLASSGLLLIVLINMLALVALHRIQGWLTRREIQVLVLVAPMVSLGLMLAEARHFTALACFQAAPRWDTLVSVILPVSMALSALGALALGLTRLILLKYMLLRWPAHTTPQIQSLQALADTLATQLSSPRVRIRVVCHNQPLALTYGIRRSVILLSTWMLDHLDRRELEAVLAHELGHVARHDALIVWGATILRDAFWYLPTSHAAYQQLQHEKEPACDDLAVSITRRPLGLASALAKIWSTAAGGAPDLIGAQAFVGPVTAVDHRITRLLDPWQPAMAPCAPRRPMRRVWVAMFLSVLALEVVNVLAQMAAMRCGQVLPGGWPL